MENLYYALCFCNGVSFLDLFGFLWIWRLGYDPSRGREAEALESSTLGLKFQLYKFHLSVIIASNSAALSHKFLNHEDLSCLIMMNFK